MVGDDDPGPHTYPALQFEHAPAPAAAYCPAPQRLLLVLGLMEPGGHANPARHPPLHVDSAWPAQSPYRPATHGPEHCAVVKPWELPYSPAAHGVHTLAPPVLYVPTGQMDAVGDVDPAGQE